MSYRTKGQFRCFQCKRYCQPKEGNWRHWNQAQVFLCGACDVATLNRPERLDKVEDRPNTFQKKW